MTRLWQLIIPLAVAAVGWGLMVIENVPSWVGYAMFVFAGLLVLLGAGKEVCDRKKMARKDPKAVAMELERMGAVVATFLRQQAEIGFPAEYDGENADIRDQHERRHVAYVRRVVAAFESGVKPQLLKRYGAAREVRLRDEALEQLLGGDIVSMQQLWEIADRFSALSRRASARD